MKHSTLMDTDDLEPIIKPKEIDFDTLSIEELKEYIDNHDEDLFEELLDNVSNETIEDTKKYYIGKETVN